MYTSQCMQCSLCAMILPSTSYLSHLRYDHSLHVSLIVRIVPAQMNPSTILPCTFVVVYNSSLYVCCRVRFFLARFIPSTVAPRTFALRTVSRMFPNTSLFFLARFDTVIFVLGGRFLVHKIKLGKMSNVCLVPPAVASTCSYYKKNRMIGLSSIFLIIFQM